jgi:hypothetical protein
MSRILFAVARGARVQSLAMWRGGCVWETPNTIHIQTLKTPSLDYRLHPDDEHLQYGPLSTALREAALTGKHVSSNAAWGALVDIDANAGGPLGDDRELFLLIVSEYLADQGA